MKMHTQSRQRGVTLFMTLIMLVVLTLFVVSAVTTSTMNLRIVNNIQSQTSSDAATQYAIEKVIGDPALASLYTPAAQTITVDTDGDGSSTGSNDLTVAVAKPLCQNNTVAPGYSATSTGSSIAPHDTRWEIQAKVDDAATGGTKVIIHQGIKVRLNASASADCL